MSKIEIGNIEVSEGYSMMVDMQTGRRTFQSTGAKINMSVSGFASTREANSFFTVLSNWIDRWNKEHG
jgi:hypothetical protein